MDCTFIVLPTTLPGDFTTVGKRTGDFIRPSAGESLRVRRFLGVLRLSTSVGEGRSASGVTGEACDTTAPRKSPISSWMAYQDEKKYYISRKHNTLQHRWSSKLGSIGAPELGP